MEASPMPTEGTKEKAAEGTNEGKPAALTDLPDVLLKVIVNSVVNGEPGQAALAKLDGASRGMRAAMRQLIAAAYGEY
jgi:hypothetical protein